MNIESFQSIVTQYKAVFLDSYGVLKTYRGLIPYADQSVQYMRDAGLEVFILTNDASRSPEQLAENFHNIGLKNIYPEEIISSGMMAKQFLQLKIREGRVAYLGTENAAHYIVQANLETISIKDVDLKNIDDITAVVFLDDEGFDWNHDINKTLNLLRRKNLPTIVANSDSIYPISKNNVSIATGSIAKLVENVLNKEFIHFGKPDSQMFMYAYEKLLEKHSIEKNDLLMVGDTLHTDILGGNKFGIDTVLVLSGNTRADKADLMIRSTGIIPDYICDSIVT